MLGTSKQIKFEAATTNRTVVYAHAYAPGQSGERNTKSHERKQEEPKPPVLE